MEASKKPFYLFQVVHVLNDYVLLASTFPWRPLHDYDMNLLMWRFTEGARTYVDELSFLFWPE